MRECEENEYNAILCYASLDLWLSCHFFFSFCFFIASVARVANSSLLSPANNASKVSINNNRDAVANEKTMAMRSKLYFMYISRMHDCFFHTRKDFSRRSLVGRSAERGANFCNVIGWPAMRCVLLLLLHSQTTSVARTCAKCAPHIHI